MYVWFAQSNFSFLQAASRPSEILEGAAANGFEGVCLSDFDGFYGLVQGHLAQRELATEHNKTLKVSYAAQVGISFSTKKEFFTAEMDLDDSLQRLPVFLQDRISFVATSKTSYGQICRLVTYLHRNSKQAESLDFEDANIPWPSEALVIVPARGTSQLFSPKQEHIFKRWLSEIEILQRRYGNKLFLALTPPTSPFERNAFLNHLEAHRRLKVELVATPDVFFHERERKVLHDMLTSIRLNIPLADLRWACFPNAERTYHSLEYYERCFKRSAILRRAFENNTRLASLVQFSPADLRYAYPSEFIPKGHTSLSYLKYLIELSLKDRYQSYVPARIDELLKKELALIEELGFSDYFLTVWDIVRFARSQGIYCQGRGSAANSAICFLLGVTGVDPSVSDVLFERFISKERGEPPDIDVDFEHERREEVIQYIYQRYGKHRAAMVANLVTFRTKGALRSVGKALGVGEEQLSHILSVISDRQSRSQGYLGILKEGLQRQQILEPQKPVFEKDVEETLTFWANMATLLRGFPRHLGMHSGGFVISQFPLNEICPTEPATMPGRYVIQWNKDDIEALGLFKIDVLALGMLTAIRKTFEALQAHHKTVPGTLLPMEIGSVPPGCSKTYAMIGEAKTTGVFQIESRAQMSILPKLRPREFYDLVIQVGIVRPGPIVSGVIRSYLKRRLGEEEATYPDERLRPILERTLGVPLFQEQVMRIAIAVGDFTPGEADELRRAMGAWKLNGNIKQFEEKLRAGMRRNGIADEFAEIIYHQVEGFAEYGFPESHATCFAYLVYISCYLKCHFPVYFLCGLLNSQPLGFYSPHSLVQEARHNGHKIIMPCVLKSRWDSYVTENGELQLGFRLLSKVQKEHIDSFVRKRDYRNNLLFHEVLAIMDDLSSIEKVALAMANCFRAFDPNRRNILWQILAEPAALFQDVARKHFQERAPLFEAWDNMQDDFKFARTSTDNHPMALMKRIAWPFDFPVEQVVPSNRLVQVRDDAKAVVAGLAIIRQCPPTAKGFVFITLEDEFGTINIVVNPKVYERFRESILFHDVICLRGVKQANGSQSVIRATEFFPIKARKAKPGERLPEWSCNEKRVFY